MNDKPSTDAHPRRRVAGIAAGAVLVLVGGAYAVGYAMSGDKLPRNASVAGVPVGGMSEAAATQTLQSELTDEMNAPIMTTIGSRSVEVDPAEAGLSPDWPATIDRAGAGRSANPVHIWRVLTGGEDVLPAVAVDEARLSAAVDEVATKVDGEAKNAAVTYAGTKVQVAKASDGIVLDRDGAARALREAYGNTEEVTLPGQVTPAEISTESAQKTAKEVAKPAVSAPVTITTGGSGDFKVTEKTIAKALAFKPVNGALEAQLDEKALLAGSTSAISALDNKEPKNARWRIADGKPVVVPAVDGTEVSAANLAKAVQPALTKSGKERTAKVELTGAQAKVSTADAEKAKVTEVVGQFTTSYPHAPYRNTNLGIVANKINNYYVAPGETFSMNKVVGERNARNGFVDGYVIQGGVLKKESGGGVSQGATTIFNAAFKAGLEDVEHHPHTLYFDRYPAGREATVYYGSLDLRFKNNTPYGVVVTSSRSKSSPGSQGSITVKIWSTKVYDKIVTPTPTKSNFTSGRTIERSGASCEYQAPIQGFDAAYYRAFITDGKEVKRENYKWRYSPGDEIKCKN